MSTPLDKKSSNAQIQARFDADVERFSNLETGQQAVIDAPLMLELISALAPKVVPQARTLLDIGCGAGNNTIKILRQLPGLDCDLLDLSANMLERAAERVNAEKSGTVRTFCGDFRALSLPTGHYDLIVAAAVLHHLRDEEDWRQGFRKIYELLAPGGALFVSDMFFHEDPQVHAAMWTRYGEYLCTLGGEEYRDKVFAYIDQEDSPRDLTFQLELMREVGFSKIDILHKNSCFGAYVAIKDR
ncbi:class I SAM-dependent methyltransferase [Ruficoccus sp. ZRK36]|uniref:class I SAM-dependent methyltransferase n=1 Tax=Ruficoccus sp. ZRK36 TaxID=2866311 RepID=UPI001C73615D|nr:class I SAM-dependent methyltransferase [Ruficoccus sp. ZRK36]QYY36507.1 class I SAM-dependent methyltransferase [Ruficoccus sp. ZRK36]